MFIGYIRAKSGVKLPISFYLFAALVVADVAVEDFGVAAVLALGEANEKQNGNGAAAAGVEDRAALAAGDFALGVLVAAEVVDVDVAVFVSQTQADAVGGVAVDPSAVGDERDDTLVSDAVGGPPECAQIGVVEAVFVGGGRASRVRLGDTGI